MKMKKKEKVDKTQLTPMLMT